MALRGSSDSRGFQRAGGARRGTSISPSRSRQAVGQEIAYGFTAACAGVPEVRDLLIEVFPVVMEQIRSNAVRGLAVSNPTRVSAVPNLPTFEEAGRLRDRLRAHCEEVGRDHPLPLYVRMAGCDPADLERYADHGYEHVTVWANQLWPADGDLATKRQRFLDAAGVLLGDLTSGVIR